MCQKLRLGYSVTPSDLQGIIAEVDVDGSGEINRREFLVCMRKLRDRTLKLVMDVIKANDEESLPSFLYPHLLNHISLEGIPGSPGKSQKEDQEDQEEVKELWGPPP